MQDQKQAAKMYFIAVVLPPHLDEKVRRYKVWMNEVYGSKVGLKSPAHITLVPPFWMEEEKESRLQGDLKTLAETNTVFPLTTAHFSAFRPRTIFIAIEQSEPLHQLKMATDLFFRHREYKMKMETRAFHPHITIATRDLSKKDFADAWHHFHHKKIREIFEASGLSLLKHNGRVWEVVLTAPFTDGTPMVPCLPL